MHEDSLRETRQGRLIADRYRIDALLGEGAMGSVWSAVHLRLDSPVAIKFLNPRIADDPEMLERFLREARSAAAVRSTHVVQIFDYGVDAGTPYIAMERLVGQTLDARLSDEGVLAPGELDKIVGEVARAIENAHSLGVVHRDLKPANIFIAREGGHEVTKVLDFGIAKLVDHRIESPTGSGTHTGIILGTPNYMSPEQARGYRTIDHRSDLWSLAVLAFECLTGRQPFESSSLGDLVVKICTAAPLLPSAVASVPAGFDAWFLRGVSKDPEARFASAGEMAEQLHALLRAAGLEAPSKPPRSSPERALPPSGDLIGSSDAASRGRAASVGKRPPASMTTHGAVATEVSNTGRPRRSGRGRLLALAALILVAAGVAIALSPQPSVDRSRIDEPARAAGAPSSAAAHLTEPANVEPPNHPAPTHVAAPEHPAPAHDDSAAPTAVKKGPNPSKSAPKRPRPSPPPPARAPDDTRPKSPRAPAPADPYSDRL